MVAVRTLAAVCIVAKVVVVAVAHKEVSRLVQAAVEEMRVMN